MFRYFSNDSRGNIKPDKYGSYGAHCKYYDYGLFIVTTFNVSVINYKNVNEGRFNVRYNIPIL